jgi:hypothetical protein
LDDWSHEQLLNLRQTEAHVLGEADDRQPVERGVVVPALTARARWRRQHAHAFVCRRLHLIPLVIRRTRIDGVQSFALSKRSAPAADQAVRRKSNQY